MAAAAIWTLKNRYISPMDGPVSRKFGMVMIIAVFDAWLLTQ